LKPIERASPAGAFTIEEMTVDWESLDELLRVQDVEGLIAAGAPGDEYEPEIEELLARLEEIPPGTASQVKIVSIFEDVWRQKFSATEQMLDQRRPHFVEIADKLLEHYE
jgi:hypothetical protein